MDVRLLFRLTLALVLGTLAALMVALLIGLSASSVNATVVLRTLFSVAVIVLIMRILVRKAYDGPRLPLTIAASGVLSYALAPAAWSGRALAGQLFADPGPVTYGIDLVLWVAVVVLAGRSVTPRPAPTAQLPYQVG